MSYQKKGARPCTLILLLIWQWLGTLRTVLRDPTHFMKQPSIRYRKHFFTDYISLSYDRKMVISFDKSDQKSFLLPQNLQRSWASKGYSIWDAEGEMENCANLHPIFLFFFAAPPTIFYWQVLFLKVVSDRISNGIAQTGFKMQNVKWWTAAVRKTTQAWPIKWRHFGNRGLYGQKKKKKNNELPHWSREKFKCKKFLLFFEHCKSLVIKSAICLAEDIYCHPRPKLSVASVYWTYTDSVHWGTLMAHWAYTNSVHYPGSTTVYTLTSTGIGSGIFSHHLQKPTWDTHKNPRDESVIQLWRARFTLIVVLGSQEGFLKFEIKAASIAGGFMQG